MTNRDPIEAGLTLFGGDDPSTLNVPADSAVPSPLARVMLVDDDPLVARTIAQMLELVGYDVTTYGDAETALARFRAEPASFDILVTDQTLPRMQGDELAHAVVALRPGIPVILCTGLSEMIGEQAARAAGARVLLAKPIDMGELSAALRDALVPTERTEPRTDRPDGGP